MTEDGDSLHVGGSVGTGEVFMGNVGEREVCDFTIIGDVVDTIGRLQGAAGAGEVLLAGETYQCVLELNGKAEPVAAWVVRTHAAGPSE